MVPEDYVHRIGRTGRAGVDGDAVSLVCVDELKLLNDIERVLGRGIPRETIPGFEPDPRIRPEPILRGGLGGSRPPSRSMSGIGAPRHAGGPRPGGQGQPRPAGHPRTVGAPRTGDWVQSGAAPRPSAAPAPRPSGGGPRPAGGGPRSGGSRPGNRGAGFAGQRRPGQGIGNGQGPRPQNQGGRPEPRPTHAQHRPNGQGTVMPGERLARHGGRPQG